MSHTIELLDKARGLCTPATDYRLAQILGVSKQAISKCRTKGKTLDNAAVHKLAAFLEQDFDSILALIELDREKRSAIREYWEKIAPRLVPSLVVGLVATAAPGTVKALTNEASPAAFSALQAIHYAKYVWALLLAIRDGLSASTRLAPRLQIAR